MIVDLFGVFLLLFFFVSSAIVGYLFLVLLKINRRFYVSCMLCSLIGHYVGGIVYFYGTLYYPADATGYFNLASSSVSSFLGSDFLRYFVWWLRYLFSDDSYLGTYAFFIGLGFLGSMFYFACYHCLLLLITKKQKFIFDFKNIKWGYMAVSCWPSSLFWGSNLGKDSLIFFSLAMMFFALVNISRYRFNVFIFLIAASLSFVIRPYLLLIGTVAIIMWYMFARKASRGILVNFFVVLIVGVIFLLFAEFLANFGGFKYSSTDIIQRSITQQNLLASGTYINLPQRTGLIALLFWPYTTLANLFFPLFFGIKNAYGFAASCENVLLLILCCKFVAHWKKWVCIRQLSILSCMSYFFVIGMAFLGLLNTNLGLACREKLMYVMPFLIVIFLTFTVKGVRRETG